MKRTIPLLLTTTLLLTACGGPKASTVELARPHSPLYERALAILQLQSQSKDASVRANCIEAVEAVTTDDRTEDMIEQALHDPAPVVRFSAVMASAKRKPAPLKPILTELAAHDPNDSVKVAAIYALRALGDSSRMNALPNYLNSSSPGTRANTALVLGLMGDPSAIPLLNSHRDDPDPRVRFELTAALARLGDTPAMQVVIAMALSLYAEDEWNAMLVCADLPSDAAAPLLQGLLPSKDATSDVRDLTTRRQLVAARSLGKRGSTQGLQVALDNLHNSNPNLRALAALAVGEIIHGTGPRVLAPLLEDPDTSVQRAAAAAIINVASRVPQK